MARYFLMVLLLMGVSSCCERSHVGTRYTAIAIVEWPPRGHHLVGTARYIGNSKDSALASLAAQAAVLGGHAMIVSRKGAIWQAQVFSSNQI